MARIKYTVRNKKVKYETRALCYIDNIIDIINRALEEDINMYLIQFAYDEKVYSVGFEKFNGLSYLAIFPNGDTIKYNSVYELRSNLNFNHNVTILREFQYEKQNSPIEVDIKDNYMLTNNIINIDDDRFNYNLNSDLVKYYNDLIKRIRNKNKIILIIAGVVAIILIASIIYLSIK